MGIPFGVIINPYAKMNMGSRSREITGQISLLAGRDALVQTSRDIPSLEKILKQFQEKKIHYLAISGGDGTIHNVISSWIKVNECSPPPILVLRGGTMNIVADSLRIKGNPYKIFRRFYEIWQEDGDIVLTTRKTLSVNGHWGNIFGAGLATNFMDYYYSGGGMGAYKAAKTIGKTIFDSYRRERPDSITRKTPARIYVEGKRLPITEFMAILSLTVRNLPLGFRPMYRAYEDENRFHIYVNNMPASQLPLIIHNAFLGKPVKKNGHFDLLVKDILIESDVPIRYTIDGDMHEASDGRIAIELAKNLQYGHFIGT